MIVDGAMWEACCMAIEAPRAVDPAARIHAAFTSSSLN
jgi:hypothetical protein